MGGWEIGLESICASFFGAPVVGYLAEVAFAYDPKAPGPSNAAALATAMLWMTTIPWAIAVAIYTALPWYLKTDSMKRLQLAEDDTTLSPQVLGLSNEEFRMEVCHESGEVIINEDTNSDNENLRLIRSG